MKFGSVCSGIEAATVAWDSLGWEAAWLSEIEPFPCAVLAHHYGDTPNLGDMTKIRDRVKDKEVVAPDVLVGGTPCQAFSVAGARKSLDDDRGQLTLEYVRLLNEIDAIRLIRGEQPAIAVWENVPGVLNTKDNAFGCFLGALAGEDCELQPAGKKWTNAGCVFGPQRAVAWRVLDAQYFGVAQRRRRVFVVASARKGFNPTEVLFEFDGVRRDIAPSREKGQEVTRSTIQGFAESSFAQFRPIDRDCGTLKRSGGVLGGGSETFIIDSTCYANGGEICDTITRKWAKGSGGPSGNETGNLVIHPQVVHGTQDPITQDSQAFPLGCNHGQENVVAVLGGLHPNAAMGKNLCPTITQAMGMGGGHIPIVNTYGIPGNWIGRKPENGGNATEPMDNIAPCQTKTDRHAVAYGIQGSMIGRSDTAGPQGSGVSSDISFTLTKGDKHAVATSLVRRLTPTECERLQGFPDSYTKIPYRNKKADDCPDGPRYAALGNSMAVPVMRWIGERIQKHIDGAI